MPPKKRPVPASVPAPPAATMFPAPPPAAVGAVMAATDEEWTTFLANMQSGAVAWPAPPSAPSQQYYKIPKKV